MLKMELFLHNCFDSKFSVQTWKLFQEGKALELVDPILDKCNPQEAFMCIQLGLLCCQATVADRPTMSSVHLILCSESFSMARPGKPGMHGRRWVGTTTSSALTKTNPSSSNSGLTKTTLTGSTALEDFSRNSISLSSVDEGRWDLFKDCSWFQKTLGCCWCINVSCEALCTWFFGNLMW